MQRTSLSFLENWLISTKRKPMVVRGARQVGKTWLIRHLAKTKGKTLIELNLEKQPHLAELFLSNDPKHIFLNLSSEFNTNFVAEKSLLFIDEIQAAPEIFAKLRWFAEDFAQLPVIAAGSLLEFLLAEHSFSMPVGRINYMHLEPLSFEEFLIANSKEVLFNYITTCDPTQKIPRSIHEQLILLFKEYLFVGGLPAAVADWVSDRSLIQLSQIHNDLISTYRDDFAKYRGRIPTERFNEIIGGTPKMLGQKYVFTRVNPLINSDTFRAVLGLFEKARICHRVTSTAANGVPLSAEINEKFFKEIFLDTGLCCSALGLSLSNINSLSEIILINKGGIAEQVVGQMLRTINLPFIEPTLYCWHREQKGASAEIDYVIQHGNCVIPIEVKAGSTGSLKSLHMFMGLKKLTMAVRINSDLPSLVNVDLCDNLGTKVNYMLLSLPFYLCGQVHRILARLLS